LHAFYRENTSSLTEWAAGLEYPAPGVTYLNMLDTHDGIGLPGVSGILPPPEIDFLIQRARQHGAFISYRSAENGYEMPYEINSTWYSALNMDNSGEDRCLQVRRFTASRSIALALKGVPAIYLHGLLGTRNDVQAALRTGSKRDVNRARVDEHYIQRMLSEPGSKLCLIRDELGRLLDMRVRHKAFHPNGEQKVLNLGPKVFAVLRTSPDGLEQILSLTNVTSGPCVLRLNLETLDLLDTQWYDLVDGRGWMARDDEMELRLDPYDVLWLMPFHHLERAIEAGKAT